MNKLLQSAFVCISMIFIASPVNADSICVSSSTELVDALNTAAINNQDDAIQIVQGNYSGNFVYASTEAFGISIEGGYTVGCVSRSVNPANTVLDGGHNESVLVMSSDQSISFNVDGITLQNGAAQTISSSGGTIGGGLRVTTFGSLSLTRSVIIGNTAQFGGGISFHAPTYSFLANMLTLSDNIIVNNAALFGGGVGSYRAAETIIISNNFINNNSAGVIRIDGTAQDGSGGGLYVRGNTVTVTNNNISENLSSDSGGGVHVSDSGSVILSNNTIHGNLSGMHGGGVAVETGSVDITLANNIIHNNIAGKDNISSIQKDYPTFGAGGGVYLQSHVTVNLINNTIINNTADHDVGGGGLSLVIENETSVGNLYNNIIWNNNAPKASDIFINNDGDGDFLAALINLFNNDFNQSAAGFDSVIAIFVDPSNLNNIDPMFIDEGNGVYYLNQNSQVIDAGMNAAPGLTATDMDGNARIINDDVDMGAYEFPGNVPELSIIPAIHYFNNKVIGSTASDNIRVYNTGGANLSIGNVALSNDLSTPFSIVTDNCSGQIMGSAQSCFVNVEFTPNDIGVSYDSYELTSSDTDEGSMVINALGISVNESVSATSSGGGGGGSMKYEPLFIFILLIMLRWCKRPLNYSRNHFK